MAARTAGRKGAPYRRAQKQVFEEETHCYICGNYVDQTLANYRSSKARSVHHLIPPDIEPELANDRANMRLAHLGCNARHGRGHYVGAPVMGPSITGSHEGPTTGPTPAGGWSGRPAPPFTTSRAW